MMSSYTRQNARRSRVWDHFVPEVHRETARCMACDAVIKTGGGCTSSLARHLDQHCPKRGESVFKRKRDGGEEEEVDEMMESGTGNLDPNIDEDDETPPTAYIVQTKLKSHAWKYFVPAESRETAQCTICGVVLKTVNFSTSSLTRHLASAHKIFGGKGNNSEVRLEQESFCIEEDEDLEQIESAGDDDDDLENQVAPSSSNNFRMKLRSTVWKHFRPSASRQKAKCKLCGAVINTIGYSTSGLKRHLKAKHKREASKLGRGEEEENTLNQDEEDPSDANDDLMGSDINSSDDDGPQDEMQMEEDDDDEDYRLSTSRKKTRLSKKRPQSHVWNHVERTEIKDRARCKICKKLLSTSGSSTSTIARHLAARHGIRGGSSENSLSSPLKTRSTKTCDVAEYFEDSTSCFVCHAEFDPESVPQSNREEYHFLLMEMLQLPIGKSFDYLEVLGRPEKWIGLCQSCQTLLSQGVSAKKKITRLQLQIEQCQEQLLKKMKANSGSRSRSLGYPKRQRRIVENIAKFVESRKYGISDDEEDTVSDDEITVQSQAFYCGLCGDDEVYRSRELLDKHTNRVHGSSNKQGKPKLSKHHVVTLKSGHCKSYQYCYQCPNCPKVKDYPLAKYIMHMRIHQKRPYQCTACSEFFPADDAPRDQHWNEKHSDSDTEHPNKFIQIKCCPGKIWKCDSCLEGFFSEDERDQHEQRCLPRDKQRARASLPVERQKPRTCVECDLRFRNIAEWRFHRAIHHPEVDSISCYYCDEHFLETTKEGMETLHEQKMLEHLTSEHSSKRFYLDCEPCGLVFDNGGEQKEHKMEVHGVPFNELYVCSTCSVNYVKLSTLRQHLSIVHFQSGFSVCDLCGESFLKPNLLLHHKYQQHDVIPEGHEISACPEEGCSYNSIFKEKVTQHFARVHEAGRQPAFICRFCPKAFKNNGRLKQHEEIHTNKYTKPYQCEICGSSFAVKNYLHMHKQQQHEGKTRKSSQKKSKRSNEGEEQGDSVIGLKAEIPDSTQVIYQDGAPSSSASTEIVQERQLPQHDNFLQVVELL